MSDEEKSLPEQLEQLADSIPHSYATLRAADFEIRHLESVNKASETLRWDDQVHHEAKIRLIEAEHERVRSTMLKYVQTAQYALGKNKLDVTAYQLDVLSDLLGVQ